VNYSIASEEPAHACFHSQDGIQMLFCCFFPLLKFLTLWRREKRVDAVDSGFVV